MPRDLRRLRRVLISYSIGRTLGLIRCSAVGMSGRLGNVTGGSVGGGMTGKEEKGATGMGKDHLHSHWRPMAMERYWQSALQRYPWALESAV